MGIKVLIDDFRLAINGEMPDIIARNYDSGWYVIRALAHDDLLRHVDLFIDHDLGENENNQNGHDIMCEIEGEVLGLKNPQFLPRSITCVSDNGPGRQRIQQVIDKLYPR